MELPPGPPVVGATPPPPPPAPDGLPPPPPPPEREGLLSDEAANRRLVATTAALGQAITALVLILPLAALAGSPTVSLVLPSTEVVLSVLWLGLLSSGVAPLLYFRLVATWGATRTTMVNYVSPIVGVSAGIVVAGERPVPALFVGGALVILGVILTNTSPAALAVLPRPIRAPRPIARPALP